MKNTTQQKLDDALLNAGKYIEQMKSMDDKQLAKHLDLFREQMERAYKQGNKEAYELLCEYEKQTIAARLMKI
ncbi:MAG: hypothetical protein LLF95_09040 [Bacteroidales bacterium]|nr:hypothetical protein [Bacteroidales bacterium]